MTALAIDLIATRIGPTNTGKKARPTYSSCSVHYIGQILIRVKYLSAATVWIYTRGRSQLLDNGGSRIHSEVQGITIGRCSLHWRLSRVSVSTFGMQGNISWISRTRDIL